MAATIGFSALSVAGIVAAAKALQMRQKMKKETPITEKEKRRKFEALYKQAKKESNKLRNDDNKLRAQFEAEKGRMQGRLSRIQAAVIRHQTAHLNDVRMQRDAR